MPDTKFEESLNADAAEIEKFESLAAHWWDETSEFKPLHDINPLRFGYIAERATLENCRAVDIGCGGGILSEALAKAGAQVTGIDMAETPLKVARTHAESHGLEIDYRLCTPEQLAKEEPGCFEIVTCLEFLEHVPDPALVVDACARLLKPGGQAFFATINRNPKSYLFAIIGAEYVLNLLPKGTHDYAKLIKPSELASFIRKTDLVLRDIRGMTYNPFTQVYKLSSNCDVNYLVHASKPNSLETVRE